MQLHQPNQDSLPDRPYPVLPLKTPNNGVMDAIKPISTQLDNRTSQANIKTLLSENRDRIEPSPQAEGESSYNRN